MLDECKDSGLEAQRTLYEDLRQCVWPGIFNFNNFNLLDQSASNIKYDDDGKLTMADLYFLCTIFRLLGTRKDF